MFFWWCVFGKMTMKKKGKKNLKIIFMTKKRRRRRLGGGEEQQEQVMKPNCIGCLLLFQARQFLPHYLQCMHPDETKLCFVPWHSQDMQVVNVLYSQGSMMRSTNRCINPVTKMMIIEVVVLESSCFNGLLETSYLESQNDSREENFTGSRSHLPCWFGYVMSQIFFGPPKIHLFPLQIRSHFGWGRVAKRSTNWRRPRSSNGTEKTLQFLSIFRPLSYVNIDIIGLRHENMQIYWSFWRLLPRQK